MKLTFNNIKTGLLIAASIALIIILLDACGKNKRSKSYIMSLEQEIQTWIDKDGKSVAKIEALETENAQAFLDLTTADEEIQFLQGEVARYKRQLKKGGSVTVFETITTVDTIFKTDSVVYTDTVYEDSVIFLNGIYTTDIKTTWIEGKLICDAVEARFDNLRFKNSYSVVVGKEKQGLFKKAQTFAEVTNHNPMTAIPTMRVFNVEAPKQKRFGIGPSIQVGYDVRDMVDGKFNGSNLKYTVGVSAQWSILAF